MKKLSHPNIVDILGEWLCFSSCLFCEILFILNYPSIAIELLFPSFWLIIIESIAPHNTSVGMLFNNFIVFILLSSNYF